MTYNQVIKTLTDLLSSHAMIKTVKNVMPGEWLKNDDTVYPVVCFFINTGSFNKGREQVYNCQFFFLDQSGVDKEFEQEVISDQVGIAYDIIELMRQGTRPFFIDDNIVFNTIADAKYEDNLAGCEFTLDITIQSAFDGCDVPII